MFATLPRTLLVFLAIVTAAPLDAAAQAPAPLPMGKTVAGKVGADGTTFTFTAPAAGVLTVAAHATEDIALSITDADGQVLPGGSADRDLFGAGGNEQLVVVLPEPGAYRVRVRLVGSSDATFDLGASWIAMPAFARPLDGDRRASLASTLEVGRSREDSLNSADGDDWDWFVVTAGSAGALTVLLRALDSSSPDLVLELYAASDLASPTVRSDDDLQGNHTNESGTVDVTAGQKVFIKVLGASSSPTGKYRLQTSIIQ